MASKTVYGFDKSGAIPFVAIHTFETSNDGQLLHLIDGRLRATIPPEGWQKYCEEYPEAQDIVDTLTIKNPAPSGDVPESGGA